MHRLYQLCLGDHPISGMWQDQHGGGGASNNTKCKIGRKIKKVRRSGKGKHQHGMQSCNVYYVNINMDSSLK